MDRTIREISDTIMDIDPNKNLDADYRKHMGLYPYFFEIRKDLYYVQAAITDGRKLGLRELFAQDLKWEDGELRKLGMAYMLKYP